MSYAALYDAVQGIKGRISTKWLRDEAIGLSEINKVREQWTSVLDTSNVRGFYIEGPKGPPVTLEEKQSLIVLARSLTKYERRFVYTKELMHVFDAEDEKADTPEKFDLQVERFKDPTVENSPQFRAETKALWRALSVLCQEERRQDYLKQHKNAEISIEVIAAALEIPAFYARNLFRDDYPSILQHIK